jgi:hypothetical protein
VSGRYGRIARRLASSRARLSLAVVLCVVALALVPAFGPSKSRLDFEIAIYYPARAFLDGLDPYEQHAYLARYPVQAPFPPFLPASLLLHAPLALLPPGPSSTLYLYVSLALVFACARLALAFTERPTGPTAVITVVALVLLSRPGRLALRLGQLSFEPICGTYLALYFARRSPGLAGVGLFLASLKPTFGVPLGLLMLARRQIRPVAIGFALTLLVNSALAVVLIRRAGGVAAFRAHLEATFDASRQGIVETSNPIMTSLRTDAASLLGRLRGHPLPSRGQAMVALAVLATAAGVLQLRGRGRAGTGEGMVAGFVCVAMLLSGYHQAYDLSLLILPAVVLARGPPGLVATDRMFRLVLGGLLLLLGANYFASEGALARFGFERETRGWLLVTSVNAVALLLAFVVYAVALARHATTASVAEPPG